MRSLGVPKGREAPGSKVGTLDLRKIDHLLPNRLGFGIVFQKDWVSRARTSHGSAGPGFGLKNRERLGNGAALKTDSAIRRL